MQTLENRKKRRCWTLPELSLLQLEGWRYKPLDSQKATDTGVA